jgi:CTD small phosphatase-like protein 2
LGSVPRVGKTPERNNKKNDYRNDSDTNLPIIKTGGKKTANQTLNGSHKQSKSFEMQNSMEMDKSSLLAKYRYLIRSPNIPTERISNFLLLVIRGLHYSTQCLKPPSKKFIQSRRIKLQERPADFKKKTLYLDLDETIVFQCKEKSEKATFEVPIDDKETLRFAARPHWKTFLEKVTEDYEIIIFTASTQYYAFLVANALDPEKKYFSGILSRNHCMLTKNGFFIKD